MKTIWSYFQALLFVLLLVSLFSGAGAFTGIILVVFLLQSFPLYFLVGWLFYEFGDVTANPLGIFLMACILSGISYLQWFELVPRITSYFKNKYSAHDKQVNILIEKNDDKLLNEADNISDEWPANVFANEKYSPVERVFNEDKN